MNARKFPVIFTRLVQWRSWSIRTRLIAIAVFPVIYLFFSLISYSYYARLKEVDEELLARAKTVSTALAEGAEYNIMSHNIEGVRQMIHSVIQSDRSIYRIEIFDAARNAVSQVVSTGKGKPEPRFFEVPIKRQLMWVSIVPETASPPPHPPLVKDDKQSDAADGLVGYVRVTMTASILLDKQRHRFAIELLMSSLALSVSAWLAWFLASGLTRPLQAATAALHAISAGRTETQMTITTGGELGVLQTSINEMAKSLYQSQQHLENTVAERTQELLLSRNEAVKADAEKRRLIHKVNSIVEAERQSIAVEIHDELNASLIAVRLESERIARIAGVAAKNGGDEANKAVFLEVQDRAKAVIKLALDLYANGRNLVRRLRPEVLELMGLQGALEEMARLYNTAQSDCHFQFSAAGDFSQLNADIAISAYRIVQEATSNILKHAQATQVEIDLQLDPEGHRMLIVITDNGQGFDPQQMVAGIGISGMRERVLVLDGEFSLRSQIGDGTQITISIPV